MKTMNPLNNQKGIALITTLMLLVLGFAVVVTLLKMVTNETKLSGLEQNYSISLDAAKGAADTFITMRQNGPLGKGLATLPSGSGSNILSSSYNNGACLQVKMDNATYPTSTTDWTNIGGWSGCPTIAQATATDSTNMQNFYDIKLNLFNKNVSYTQYVKVIDTQVIAPTGCTPQPCQCDHGCYIHTVNVLSVAPKGQSQVTFVYEWDPHQ
jgi:Tfp pilus assembly protein PilX